MGGWKVCFWNVAGGLAGKDDDFWKGQRDWDISTVRDVCGGKRMGKSEGEIAEGIQVVREMSGEAE